MGLLPGQDRRSWRPTRTTGGRSAENHIGNGPFNVTGIDEEQRWTFAANENYWQGRPKLDGIEYLYVEDAAVALEAYRAGDLDIVQLEPPQIPEVQADPELSEGSSSIYPTASTYKLEMNLNLEPFNDLKVREAFAYAFDRETYCAEVRSGDCTPTLSWIPPGIPGAIETDKFAFDPEAAGRLWPSPPTAVRKTCPRSSSTTTASAPARPSEPSGWPASTATSSASSSILEPTDGTTLTR